MYIFFSDGVLKSFRVPSKSLDSSFGLMEEVKVEFGGWLHVEEGFNF